MLLKEGIIGKDYEVVELNVDDGVKRRLEALGMIHDTKVKVLNCKRSGSLIFSVRGTRLAVGHKLAEKIVIKECEKNVR